MIFTTTYETRNSSKYLEIYYEYDKSPKDDDSDDNTFIEPIKMGKCPGDVSVPSFSPLIYLAKWIHDGTNGDHSVQAVEYCGKYKGKKDHYSTLLCECYENPFKNPLDCTHPCIISDKYLI